MKISKKSISLSFQKIVLFILLIIVFVVIIPWISNIYKTTKQGVDCAIDESCVTGEDEDEDDEDNGDSSEEEEEGCDVSCERWDENVPEIIKDFAKKEKIELEKIYSIFEIESNGRYFYNDGHPIVRFECGRYNKKVEESEKVSPCGTGKDAFLKAYKDPSKNQKEVLKQTSYGIAQVLGENYELVGYKNVSEMYKDMKTKEGQITAFLNFIKNAQKGGILEEFKKENTNWDKVAKVYNGANYPKEYVTELKCNYKCYKKTTS